MKNGNCQAALITGASRGLGRALALRLAREGTRLALVAREREELEKVAAEIRSLYGADYPVVVLAADVGDKAATHGIAARAAHAVGPIDLLINNASRLGSLPLGLLMDTDCEDLEAVLEANLLGPFRLSKVLAGPMLLRQHGLILNISSDAAVEAYPRWGSYGVSKAGLDHLTRVFALELAGTGVRFLSVDPGEMNTRMHADAMPEADPRELADPGQVAEQLVSMIRAAREIPSGSRITVRQWASRGTALQEAL